MNNFWRDVTHNNECSWDPFKTQPFKTAYFMSPKKKKKNGSSIWKTVRNIRRKEIKMEVLENGRYSRL